MKVNHKTFTGGYKFNNFEGQPSGDVVLYKPVKDMIGSVIEPGRGITAADVLDALNLTGFSGPDTALTETVGKIAPYDVRDIVISTVETEPYSLPMKSMVNQATKGQFISGLRNIQESYPRAKMTLVIGEDQIDLVQLLSAEVKRLSRVSLVTIASKYPANRKELTVPVVLGKKYPVGYGPAHLGMLWLGIKDVFQVAKSVTEKKVVNSTVLALSGPGWKKNLVLDVPVGTKVKDIAKSYMAEGEIRLVKNSILSGGLLTDEDTVTFDTDVIIAVPEDRRRQVLFFLRGGKNADSFTNTFLSKLLPKSEKTAGTNLQGERRACVSCTYCQSVCPVGLIPHLLHKHADKNIINKRLAEYNIFDCIECGLCDYVCPSKIEVVSNIKLAKEELEKAEISHKEYVIPECDIVAQTSREVAAGE